MYMYSYIYIFNFLNCWIWLTRWDMVDICAQWCEQSDTLYNKADHPQRYSHKIIKCWRQCCNILNQHKTTLPKQWEVAPHLHLQNIIVCAYTALKRSSYIDIFRANTLVSDKLLPFLRHLNRIEASDSLSSHLLRLSVSFAHLHCPKMCSYSTVKLEQ